MQESKYHKDDGFIGSLWKDAVLRIYASPGYRVICRKNDAVDKAPAHLALELEKVETSEPLQSVSVEGQ